MESIAIDSNVIISFLDTQDAKHAVAVELARYIQSRYGGIVIVNVILYEVLTILSMKGHKKRAVGFYNEICADKAVQLVYSDEAIERAAMEHFYGAETKNISFADCALIASAEFFGADAIASFDLHLKRYSRIVPVLDGAGN
ncbi:MAG: hypothetical protein A3H70_01275 [Candidatus Komeilibacteria bacterium RIFCSPLOWO2_02_FULL_48_11]|uniref:PIN domain-containing protein n=1 Tax=Candidatus Komeilibacteria bacterium RIFCSPLOWO2_02_FULL_48_11 TaxID=1798553 RepID=A0A1G2BQQ0_9BACT|nr:MAG: hypothetical protein A3H70_01275 [Candidatus Komeilibacteria bacterium RIFCSPLOWO2_02_FULL_48_11]